MGRGPLLDSTYAYIYFMHAYDTSAATSFRHTPRSGVSSFLSLAGIPAEREAPSLLPGSAARPADTFVPNFAGTQAACLDFAVTHTQQSNILHCVSVCGGAAAERYEGAVKDAKFGEECQAAGLLLVRMVVEVFGRWGERSAEAMKLATKGCANRASERVAFAGAGVELLVP